MSKGNVKYHGQSSSVLFNFTRSSRAGNAIEKRTQLSHLLEKHLRNGKVLLLKYEPSSVEFEIIPFHLGQEFFSTLEEMFPDQELEWRTSHQIVIDVNSKELDLSELRNMVFKPITHTLKDRSSFLSGVLTLMKNRDSFTNSEEARNEIRKLKSSLLGLANRIYDDASSVKIHVFGSRLTGLATCKSDIDVFMEKDSSFHEPLSHEEQGEMVKLFAEAMQNVPKREFKDVETIPSAFVPIVKFHHKSLKLNCDLSFKSGMNVLNSRLVKIYLLLDDRVRFVTCGVNYWMRMTGLPFISYAQVWMVLFFLMQKKYSVVPTLLELRSHMPAKKRMLLIEGWNCACPEDITDVGWWRKDRCTLSGEELLREFFVFYGDMNIQKFVLCTSTGLKVDKKDIVVESEKLINHLPEIEDFEQDMIIRFRDSNNFCVQDPFDLCKNLTKNIRCLSHKFTKFVKRCEQTKDMLLEF